MALTIETGAGLANADAFISVVDADIYHAARGNSTWAGLDAAKEIAVRRATEVLNGYPWQGFKTKYRDQALSWPRHSVFDREGNPIESNEIPVEIIRACAELALRELTSPGSLTPDVTLSEKVKREKVGALEVEYLNSDTSASAAKPVLTIISPLIDQFLAAGSGGSGQAIVGASFRA